MFKYILKKEAYEGIIYSVVNDYNVHKRQDLIQEAWLYILKKQPKIVEYIDNNVGGIEGKEGLLGFFIQKRLKSHIYKTHLKLFKANTYSLEEESIDYDEPFHQDFAVSYDLNAVTRDMPFVHRFILTKFLLEGFTVEEIGYLYYDVTRLKTRKAINKVINTYITFQNKTHRSL